MADGQGRGPGGPGLSALATDARYKYRWLHPLTH